MTLLGFAAYLLVGLIIGVVLARDAAKPVRNSYADRDTDLELGGTVLLGMIFWPLVLAFFAVSTIGKCIRASVE